MHERRYYSAGERGLHHVARHTCLVLPHVVLIAIRCAQIGTVVPNLALFRCLNSGLRRDQWHVHPRPRISRDVRQLRHHFGSFFSQNHFGSFFSIRVPLHTFSFLFFFRFFLVCRIVLYLVLMRTAAFLGLRSCSHLQHTHILPPSHLPTHPTHPTTHPPITHPTDPPTHLHHTQSSDGPTRSTFSVVFWYNFHLIRVLNSGL